MNWLCWLSFHQWVETTDRRKYYGIGGPAIVSVKVRICTRCHKVEDL